MATTTETAFRFEVKYCIYLVQVPSVINIFAENGLSLAYPSRTVRSLYFDTACFRFLNENLDGQSSRRKLRLRWYFDGGNDQSIAVTLESKIKNGGIGYKRSYSLGSFHSSTSVSRLCRRIPSLMLELHGEPVDFSGLIPQHVTTYRRNYYQSRDGLRGTLDTSIVFTDSFDATLVCPEFTHRYSKAIVELKYPLDQMEAAGALRRSFGVPASRCSKYVLGQSLLRSFSYL